MARREWADKKALKFWHGHRGGLSDYGAKLLMMEHARAVRIVRRLKRGYEKRNQDGVFFDRIDTCAYILRLLMKGRA